MSKRGRGDQLTGGSGDVNPQEMVSPLLDASVGTQVTSNLTGVQVVLPLPIPRLRTQGQRQLIIELLWAVFYLIGAPLEATTGDNLKYVNVTTNPSPILSVPDGVKDPRTLADFLTHILVNASPVSVAQIFTTQEVDLTDSAGHGLLVATDQLYFNLVVNNTTTTLSGTDTAFVRLGYRFKDVSLAEYVGIVQSQQ